MKKLFSTLSFGLIVLTIFTLAACGGSGSSSSAGSTPSATSSSSSSLTIAFLPKQINNPYFDTAASGGKEAATALGGQFQQVGPSSANAAAQVPFITTLTEQHTGAIVISGDDPNAVAPALKQAMSQGVKVVSYDADVAPDARNVFINQADSEQIGRSEVALLAKQINSTGQIAILSASSTAANQNTWIGFMKQELTKYPNMTLVKIAYGNDDDQTSFNDTLALLQQYPNLKGIISPTTVGIAAAARALESVKKGGTVALTGLGTPNQLRQYVKDGTIKGFELWNPADLGYLAYYVAALLIQGKIQGNVGDTFTAGKLGSYTIGANHVVLLGPPTVFNSANIDQFNF
ncbi:MAG TPA: rhamnose ABC transporter substrate-binding protein [Ktedonobacteraceae bacterium]|nr:rhamnose ABC transporter substrate-binding protein [Ktedonobacteraceae bacterium]